MKGIIMRYLINRKVIMAVAAAGVILIAWIFSFEGCGKASPQKIQGEEYAQLTYAPNVPPPITRDYPTKVIVNLEAVQVTGRLADGVSYNFWTFGGRVPGKFIRVRVGDEVEFHLHNSPTSTMAHSIDLHAVIGPGGGAISSQTLPGHTSVFSFKATRAGLYVYHCATQPVPLHIANGMYGLILVEPKEGLPPVDHEYYIMQSEFYTKGNYGDPGLQEFSMEKALSEQPTYVVFNGSVGALMDNNAITAKVGETVRLYVGNIGPNLISSFHVIGEIFDKVWQYGGENVTQQNVQTVLIPAGGAAIVQFKVKVPGTYLLVDHSIFRAFNKGATGMLKVTGEPDKEIFSGKQKDEIYLGSNLDKELESDSAASPGTSEPSANPNDINAIVEMGKNVFSTTCFACHQPNGEGVPGVFPPLAGSNFLNQDKERAIGIVLHGRTGPITVNGKNFNNTMPPQSLSDAQIAAVLTYVYHSFGNSGKVVTQQEVNKIRNQNNGKGK